MFEVYNDDELFQGMARGTHDAVILATVLYGKQESKKSERPQTNLKNGNKEKKNGRRVQFRCGEGRFKIDPELLGEEDGEYMSRSKDNTFQPVKTSLDFVKNDQCSGVQTDVYIFNRSASSEFDTEREELKDDLVAWNERYMKRLKK